MSAEGVLDFLRSHASLLVIGHQEPDADCLGSQLALASFLARHGKKVKLYSHGPFKRAEINRYQPLFAPRVDPFDKVSRPGVVVLDCSTLDRIGDLKDDIAGLETAVVDHHASTQPFGTVSWVDSRRASCAELVLELMQRWGGQPNAEEATWLLLGLSTDTGFFRHLEADGAPAFLAAAELTSRGASPKAIYQQINGGKVLANQRLMGLILSRTESHYGGRLMYSWEELEDRARFGAEARDSDALYQILQGVSGVELIVLLRQETATTVTGGLRSKAFVDVAALAQHFGGGGHVRASGFLCPGTVAEVKARLLAAVRAEFSAPA